MKRVGKNVINRICSYAIMCENDCSPNDYFDFVNFRSFRTMHKYMNELKKLADIGKLHNHYILCSRDSDGNIIRIYDEVNAL